MQPPGDAASSRGGLDPARSAQAFLAAARCHPAALLVEGQAGIGKTTLGEQVVEDARRLGFRVMGTRVAQPQTALSYSALDDLLRGVGDEELDHLPPPQREALDAALLRRTAGEAMQDPRAISLAALSVVHRLARAGPVLVAIDDLQWLDASSARVVGFVLQRLDEQPVGVLATRRTGEPGDLPLDLERAMGSRRVSRVELGPMGREPFGRLLRERVGPDLPHSVVSRLHRIAEGNPFYGLQLAREVVRRGVPDPGAPLPLDPDTSALLHNRFTVLPDDVRAVLLVLGLGSRVTVDLLAAAQPDVDVEAALSRAEDEGLVVVQGGRVRFAHAIFASALSGAATPTALRAAHLRLATVLDNEEEKGRHLALSATRPDETTARALARAHRAARRRGAAAAAAELAQLAVRHTPADLVEERRSRSVVAGMLTFEAGDANRALVLLREALDSMAPGPSRAEVMVTLCEICWQDTLEIEALACEALDQPGVEDGPAASAHLMLAWVWVYRGDLQRADDEVSAARSLVTADDDVGLRSDALTIGALVDFLSGRPFLDTLEEAVALEDLGDPAGPADSTTVYSGARVTRGLALLWAGDLAGARSRLEEELDRFEALGRYVARDEVLCYLAHLECRTGRWDAARRRVEECLDIGEESGHLRGRGQNIVPRAWVNAVQGDLAAARRDALEGLELSVGFQDHLAAAGCHGVLGFAELSDGRPGEAVPHLLAVCDFLRDSGTTEPGQVPFVADALEALVAVGRLDEAEAIAADDRLVGRSACHPATAAQAVRGVAAVRAASGDLSGAADALGRVLAEGHLEALPFERARTLLVAGEVERRARRRPEARRLLQEAHDELARLGATAWAARAEDELRRVDGAAGGLGAVGPQGGRLSATEAQVAALVAEGLTNREVADRLFLSVKTVEANLSRIYRKLALRSRADLVRRLVAEAGTSGP
ncbi:helix-turn-helix transcriptional regulator [Nocardioides marmoribigeumensis]|uniref:DNA-binding CsgD family transcriptional regulator/ADP-ribose pyrophosphatase YjhB (NUDIX family) n=1 Tax=Nocardioides marmoribigeumensis TaxID=433649 RepID=A0ABU2BWS6_9ACTN|nr:LuxR C-terminal-related transcriptional regulator [Nocardioides marmoribigeumensis]MDR7362104.1 DNA-binding CsgD family transcriptional regulator/ADP-ribose pyrophosphatase YjhB (NUDIX family) [Nocardioides marmoribigeumensis]